MSSNLEEYIKQISNKQDATYSKPPKNSNNVRIIPPLGEIIDEVELEEQQIEVIKPKLKLPTSIKPESKKPLDKQDNTDESEELFIKSGTDLQFKEEWLNLYNHAKKQPKDNYVSRAFCAGKFRINKDGKKEILPNYDTYNKSANDMLKETWL